MDCVRSLIWQTKNRGSRKAPRSLVKITPHKGGRTARFEARLTPAEKEAIMKVIQASGLSYSDWLVQVSGTANTALPDKAIALPVTLTDQYIKEYWDCFKKYLPTECLEFYRKGIKNDSFSLAVKYRQYKLGYIGDYDYWNLVYSWVIGKYFAELELIK